MNKIEMANIQKAVVILSNMQSQQLVNYLYLKFHALFTPEEKKVDILRTFSAFQLVIAELFERYKSDSVDAPEAKQVGLAAFSFWVFFL